MTRRRALPDDGGFTLVEVLVATMVAVLFFAIVGAALSVAVRGAVVNRLDQRATAVAIEQIEIARALTWAELAMTAVDPAAPMLTGDGGAIDSAEAGTPTDELLVVSTEGAIGPKIVETVGDAAFTAWVYVTEVTADLRRVVTHVVWDIEGEERSTITDTVVSRVSAGGVSTTSTTTTQP